MSEEYKVSIPLFEPNELETFDNHIHEIIEEYSKMMFKEKDQILTQRIIMKQEQEIERLNNKVEELQDLYTSEREVKDYYKNILNELEKWSEDYRFANIFKNKLQELKGVDKE